MFDRSNPSTPTQVRRPNYIGIADQKESKYYSPKQLDHQSKDSMNMCESQHSYGSQNEVIQHVNDKISHNIVENIRELAGSPQRGVYTWKDCSPSSVTTYAPAMGCENKYQSNPRQQTLYEHYYSNPTSPIQQIFSNAVPKSVVHSVTRSGVPVLPPLPPSQIKNQSTMMTSIIPSASENKQKPLALSRGLNMTETDVTDSDFNIRNTEHNKDSNTNKPTTGDISRSRIETNVSKAVTPTTDRGKVYDINYEISV